MYCHHPCHIAKRIVFERLGDKDIASDPTFTQLAAEEQTSMMRRMIA